MVCGYGISMSFYVANFRKVHAARRRQVTATMAQSIVVPTDNLQMMFAGVIVMPMRSAGKMHWYLDPLAL